MRIEVTRGGEPTDEELAALVLALSPVTVPADTAPSHPPAWGRAALLEGVGSRQPVSADDLAALQRGAGRIMTSDGGS